MKAKVINIDSPILREYGVKIGMIGICLPNDFEEKYQYKVSFQNIQAVLYFYDHEVKIIND